MTNLGGRRGLFFALTAVMALVVGCSAGGICESDSDRNQRESTERLMRESIAKMSAPSATSTSTPMPTSTSTAVAATTAAPAATGPFGGKIALGFDHPPFATGNANLGGASAGIVCGVLTSVPGGSTVTITLSGGTGAPSSINAPVGGEGAFLVPFPINSYGALNAAVGGVKTAAGAALTGTVAPATLPVAGGADVACNGR